MVHVLASYMLPTAAVEIHVLASYMLPTAAVEIKMLVFPLL
jgi:hypothetical protein